MEGQFKDGEPHGYARVIDLQGNIFEGQFINGVKSGRGKEKNIHGKETYGYWKNDEYQETISLQINSLEENFEQLKIIQNQGKISKEKRL